MADLNELKACIVRRGKTAEDCAKMLNITAKTFSSRMKTGVFGSDEIEKLVDFLEIDDPMRVFFPQWVT